MMTDCKNGKRGNDITNKKTFILTIITSIVLFILAFMQFGEIFDLILPKVENLKYQVTENPFRIQLLFSMVIGLTPVFLHATWRIARIEIPIRRIFSALIVIASMFLASSQCLPTGTLCYSYIFKT